MATSIATARANLHSLLVTAAPTSSTQPDRKVQVAFGPPDSYEDQEVIALLGVETPDEDARALGRNQRHEEYVLIVGVKAYDPTGTAASVDARVYALADVVRSTVNGNDTLKVNNVPAVYDAAPVSLRSRFPDGVIPHVDGGWISILEVVIRVQQRIS